MPPRLTIQEAEARCPDMVKGQTWRGTRRKYKFLCPVVHGEYWQTYGNHQHGSKCPICAPNHTVDITHQRFGRLTAIAPTNDRTSDGRVKWRCLCDCGVKCCKSVKSLQSGDTKSCGCLFREVVGQANVTHGHAKSPEYMIWASAVARCTNPNNSRFKQYGGANPPVHICERWRTSFEHFLADLAYRPSPKHSLSRFLDTGSYEPSNVEWAPIAQQKAEAQGRKALLAYRAARLAGQIIWDDIAAQAA